MGVVAPDAPISLDRLVEKADRRAFGLKETFPLKAAGPLGGVTTHVCDCILI